MPNIIIYIALAVFFIGVVAQQKKQNSTPTPTLTPSPTLTSTPSETPTITPTPMKQKPAGNLQSFQYPGSSVTSSDTSTMHLISPNDSDAITVWYKEKIKSEGFRSTAFAVTKTNGNVLTKLAGSKQGTKIQIEITKPASESVTKISVSLDAY